MATCTNCGYKWKAKDIWKLSLAKDGKDCPECRVRQYPSFKGEGLLLGLGYLSGTIGLILIVLFPYYVRLSDRHDDFRQGGGS